MRRDRHHGPRPHRRAGRAARSCCASTSPKCCSSCRARSSRQRARALPLRIIEASDRVEITTDDLEGTLRTLLDAQVPLTNLRIRPANLEDLFLELTGTELRP